nr:DEAD/DEAH box helicase [Actinomycetales bacterium]
MSDALARFSAPTRRWFEGAFGGPTTAQAGAWDAIGRGEHTLVVAPTGSGKTLAAFLWAIDALSGVPAPTEAGERCRVLYLSPMKALAVDVEKNLREPLAGIAAAARSMGEAITPLEVGVRSGDTPAGARRAFIRRGTDILITTPESLFLLLTSRAREMLGAVEHVIVDEVHALAGTKRGAHLAVSLERLDALLPQPAQRIGLSATVRPVDEVQRFLAGGRPVTLVRPPSVKQWDLTITVPVEDMGDLADSGRGVGGVRRGVDGTGGVRGGAAGPRRGAGEERYASSIWPHVEERIVQLIAEHRSTIVFANSRRIAERLTARINELWEERAGIWEQLPGDAEVWWESLAGAGGETLGGETPGGARAAGDGSAGVRQSRIRETTLATHNVGAGRPPVLARAHHGSVSREQRLLIEDDLKAGRIPAVVATSSLELGIDMGEVDLVIQVEAPPSVASGLQRVGRAGHQVGATSHGVSLPKHRGDLVQTVVVVRRMRESVIEALHVPASPLDVLAQQVVAMCAMDEWKVPDLLAAVTRSAPFAGLSRPVLESVLDMLAGRYPSDEFAELRPRIVWDRTTGTLTGRPGAQRLAVTSGGTIPDRGLYGVFVAGDGPGRRVGELDEEMVYESRVGDVFLLGTTGWRIESITHDQVIVTPAGHQPGRLPFWRADTQGRPAELGAAVGEFLRTAGRGGPEVEEALAEDGLDTLARTNLLRYLGEQREQTGYVPDDRTVVVERWRDELGDWQVAVHSIFGLRVNAPWAMVVAARLRDATGVDVQALPADDGIVVRLPDSDLDPARLDAVLRAALLLEPGEVRALVTDELGGSPMFTARFRESAARALLLPRRNPGRRQALWQQRQRAAQLLQVASRYPTFPIVLEAVRECLQDVFDVPALESLMADLAARRVTLAEVQTATPSPFARTLLFGYVGQFLYEGDQPLAERRAAALALDPVLLEELLGAGAAALADLLDPEVVEETEAELQGLAGARQARDAEGLADLLRRLGPLSVGDVGARVAAPGSGSVSRWLEELRTAGRALAVAGADGGEGAGGDARAGEGARAGVGAAARAGAGSECVADWVGNRWIAVEDAGLMRDGLGVRLPRGVPAAFLDPVPGALSVLVRRFARSRGPFTAAEVAAWLGLPDSAAGGVLAELVDSGVLVHGRLRPGSPADERHWCDAEVLRRLRRRSLAAQRAQAEPVAQRTFARFLPEWQGVGAAGGGGATTGGDRRGVVGRPPGLEGADGLLRAVEQLAGAPVPASALESLVLPARVADYAPRLLDDALAEG